VSARFAEYFKMHVCLAGDSCDRSNCQSQYQAIIVEVRDEAKFASESMRGAHGGVPIDLPADTADVASLLVYSSQKCLLNTPECGEAVEHPLSHIAACYPSVASTLREYTAETHKCGYDANISTGSNGRDQHLCGENFVAFGKHCITPSHLALQQLSKSADPGIEYIFTRRGHLRRGAVEK